MNASFQSNFIPLDFDSICFENFSSSMNNFHKKCRVCGDEALCEFGYIFEMNDTQNIFN